MKRFIVGFSTREVLAELASLGQVIASSTSGDGGEVALRVTDEAKVDAIGRLPGVTEVRQDDDQRSYLWGLARLVGRH